MEFKRICLVMCLALLLSITGTVHAEEEVMPCYAYICSINVKFSISGGIVTAVGEIKPQDGQHTSVTVRLQRENSAGTWTTIETWTGSNAAGKSEAGGTRALISGYNYRVYVIGRVYDDEGTLIETAYKYSPTKSY